MFFLSSIAGTCELRSGPALRPSEGEVLLKILATGICRTDLYVAAGEIPVPNGRVIGHEGFGIIEQVGSADSIFKAGQKAAIIPLKACGKCSLCLSGTPVQCPYHRYMGIDYDGCFATHVLLKESELMLLPEDLSPLIGAYFEPVAATLGVLSPLQKRGTKIGVSGSGRIHDLTLQILHHHGFWRAEPVDLHSSYECVVECQLDQQGLEQLIDVLEPKGQFILKSRSPFPTTLQLFPLIRKQIRIDSVYYADPTKAKEYLIEHQEELHNYLGKSYPLEEFEEAFEQASKGEQQKLFFTP